MGSTASEKYDVKRDRRELYAASARDFTIVDVPPMTYLAVDGRGDPNTAAEYADAAKEPPQGNRTSAAPDAGIGANLGQAVYFAEGNRTVGDEA